MSEEQQQYPVMVDVRELFEVTKKTSLMLQKGQRSKETMGGTNPFQCPSSNKNNKKKKMRHRASLDSKKFPSATPCSIYVAST